jgi:hypothetical protein
MAGAGFTLIQLFRSATPGAVPLAASLEPGELAINTVDEKLFFKNSGGSVVEFSGGFSYTDVKTANYTAEVGEGVQTNTTGGSFTVTLPATPASGDQVIITDAAESWGVNNLTVARNGSLIEGIASDLICNISGVAITMIYTGTSWQVYAQAGGAGGIIDINTQTTGTLGVNRGGTGAVTLTGVVKGTGTSALTAGTVNMASEVSGTLPVANGGTGAATLTGVVKGNGTSAMTAGTVALASEVSGTLPVANGGTGLTSAGTAGNVLTSDGTSWASTALPSNAVAYPQNIQSANYTLILSDAGKQIFHPVADTTVRKYTIPANASVAFPIGTVVLFTVENGGTAVNVAITTDTLVFGGGTTGELRVLANNTLMAIKVTATKWMANFLYQTGSAIAPYAMAVAHTTTPFISAYPWNSAGFGTKYTNPATLPANNGNEVAFSPAGDAIAVAHATTPFITAYPWSGSGFGTKYTNPATLPTGDGQSVAFSPAGNAVAVGHSTTPFITAYPWSSSTGFGTKYTNPATLPANVGLDVAFNPASTSIAVAHVTTPFITAYPWNAGTGFGTKYADPATLPASTGTGVAFSPAGDAIAVAHGVTPFITAYPWNAGTGFGTKYADPATLPTNTGNEVAFNPAGTSIAVAHGGTPFVTAYPWSGGGFGTKYADPATLPANNGNGVAFSPAGDAIAVAHTTSPHISAYPWDASTGFGTKYTNPATLPTGAGNGVAFTTAP